MACGIGIVSADASAAGAASVPSPGSDSSWPGWIWYHAGGPLISLETTEVARGPLSAVRFTIDTKAKRKFRQNEVVFGAVQFFTEIGTATAIFVMRTRMLTILGK